MKVIFHFFQHNYVYLNEKSHSNVFCEIAWTNFSYGIEKEQSTHMQYIIKYYFLRNIFLIILYHSKNVISFDNCITWQLNYLILNIFYEFFNYYWLGESHIISKYIFVTMFLTTIMCLHLIITNYSTLGYFILILHILPWVFSILFYVILF